MEDQDRQRLASLEAKLRALTARQNALAEGHFEINAEGFRVGSTRLLEKLVSHAEHDDEYHLHQRDSEGTESDLTGARSIQGIPVSETAPTTTQILGYNATTNAWTPTAAGAAAAHETTHRSGGADELSHDNLAGVSADDHHAQSHNVASHSDTTATGAELETLTDGSDADALHDHPQFASAAEAIAAVEGEATLDLTGDVTIAAAKSLAVDTISEKTGAAGVTIDGTKLKDGYIYPLSSQPTSFIQSVGGDLIIQGDTGDYIQFNDGANLWLFVLGGNSILGFSPAATIFYVPFQVDTINEKTADAGVTVDGVTLKDDAIEVDAVRGLKESGGQALDMGAVADGEYLKRSGTDIVGDAGSGGQDLATDTLWAADGDMVIGTGDDGAEILSANNDGDFLRLNATPQPYWDAPGIADTNPLVVDATDGAPVDDEYARFTATGLEGRTEAQFKGDFNLEDADINTLAVAAVAAADDYVKNDANDETSGTVTAAGFTTTGIATLQNVAIDSTPANDTCSGITAELTAGAALTRGNFCYVGADGKMEKALATAESTSRVIAVVEEATIAENATGTFLLHGFIEKEFNFSTVGARIYLSDDTAGAHDETQPADTDETVVILGIAMGADCLYFNPSVQAIVEHT